MQQRIIASGESDGGEHVMETIPIYGVIGKELTLTDIASHKRGEFITNQSDLLQYNGKDFVIVRSLVESEVDLEVAPMFKVRFEDGFETDAYMDEIYKESLFDIIQDDNLLRGWEESPFINTYIQTKKRSGLLPDSLLCISTRRGVAHMTNLLSNVDPNPILTRVSDRLLFVHFTYAWHLQSIRSVGLNASTDGQMGKGLYCCLCHDEEFVDTIDRTIKFMKDEVNWKRVADHLV